MRKKREKNECEEKQRRGEDGLRERSVCLQVIYRARKTLQRTRDDVHQRSYTIAGLVIRHRTHAEKSKNADCKDADNEKYGERSHARNRTMCAKYSKIPLVGI